MPHQVSKEGKDCPVDLDCHSPSVVLVAMEQEMSTSALDGKSIYPICMEQRQGPTEETDQLSSFFNEQDKPIIVLISTGPDGVGSLVRWFVGSITDRIIISLALLRKWEPR